MRSPRASAAAVGTRERALCILKIITIKRCRATAHEAVSNGNSVGLP